MRVRAGVLKLIYAVSIVLTCLVLLQVMQVNWMLYQVKTIEQALKLLDFDNYWIINLASRIMADGRDTMSIMILVLDEIKLSYLLTVCCLLFVFYRTKLFWKIITMILIPYGLYSLTLIPLVYGIFSQRVTTTIHTVNFMALMTVCICVLISIVYLTKLVLFGCGILEVRGGFNYNNLERGDRNVRNNE